MNTRKILLITSTLAACMSTSAYAFTVTNNAAFSVPQCTELNEDKYLYVNRDNSIVDNGNTFQSFYLNDTFYNQGQEFVIRGTTSSINVRNNLETSKVYAPQNYNDWRFVTNYAPATNGRYVVFAAQNPVQVNQSALAPTDSTSPAFQIAYTISRVRTQAGSPRSLGPVVWQYVPFGGSVQYPFGSTARSIAVEQTDISKVECFNYYARWCGDGLLTNSETCDPAAPGQSPTTCSPTTCTPIVTPPVCNPAKTGTQPAPVLATDTLCTVGTVSAFVATASGNTTNYTWSCNTNTAVNCSANYTVVPTSTGSFDLSIKKYAKSEDVFASVDNTENYNYTIVVRNNGTGAVTGTTTVKDKLPAPITLRATPSGNGWTCTGAAGAADFTCTTTKSYAPDTEFDVITVPVQITNLVFRPEAYVNYAYVQNPNETPLKQCNTNGSMPDPSLGGTNGQTPTAVCNEDKNNFDPATVNPPNPNGFDLKLKKFVNGDDESSPVRPGGTATYTFVMQNLGAQASTGTTTVTDESFPVGVTIASIAATQGEWSCTKNSDTKFTCTTTKSYAAGEYATPITLTAGIASTMAVGTYRNVACLSNPSDPNENQVLDPSTGKYKVNNCDPAEVVVVPASAFDLSIKKYVADTTTGIAERDGDHQTTNDGTDVNRDILTIPQGGTARYRFVIKNEGPATATGLTTVEDTLPNGFTITGSVVGTGWSCSVTGNGNRSFSCTRTENLAVGASFPEIVVNALSDAAILAGEYSNTATVKNPGDANPDNNTDPANVQIVTSVPSCGTLTGSLVNPVGPSSVVAYTCTAANYTGALTNLEYQINCGTGTGTWSASATGSCTAPSSNNATMSVTCGVRDRTNTGTVFSGSFVNSCSTTITTTGGGGCGSSYYYTPTCINGIRACATVLSCTQPTGSYPTLAECNEKNTLSCSGGGGGDGYCGDGVLQVGEECDVKNVAWCNASCKIDLTTNPGANPITSLKLKIPALGTVGSATVGTSIPVSAHRVVIGWQTSVFTLSDEVILDIDTKYDIPVMIPADRLFCLQATGTAVEKNTLCNPISRYLNATTINGQSYVVLGNGYYQVKKNDGKYENVSVSRPVGAVTLFKGFDISSLSNANGQVTPRDAFRGVGAANTTSDITLYNRDPYKDPSGAISLAYFPVRVSGAIVGTTGTPVNRSIETFVRITPQTILANFGIGTKNTTTTSTTTNTVATNTLGTVSLVGVSTGDKSVEKISDIPALNGNQNIRAIKGNLNVMCPPANKSFELVGVVTIIVEGNITFNCNTAYASNDTSSSVAWIAKGGNITVDKSVTNLAGVYVAIGDTVNTGKFDSINSEPTNTILKIDGSLYGNANPLFSSRLYARGTSAYDILTTGTIITYSNRALVNPPPLLSQYLGNYSVERVVK